MPRPRSRPYPPDTNETLRPCLALAQRTPATKRHSVRRSYLVDELARHRADRDAPHEQPEADQRGHAGDVGPALPAEGGVADELDAVVQRVEVAGDLSPLRQLAEREERARDEEERREHG